MNRKIYEDLTSKEKIELKKYFYGVSLIPKLLKFEVINKEIYWKNVKLISEHFLIDSRLYFLKSLDLQNMNGMYWTDGIELYNLNNLDFEKLKIEKIKFSELKKYSEENLLVFKKHSNFFSYWRYKKNKKSSDTISNFLILHTLNKINPLQIETYKTNEHTLLMTIFNNVKLDDSNIIELNFEPFEYYDFSLVPLFLQDLFKTNKAYKALILGIYLKILTNPTEENKILLDCLNMKIQKHSFKK